MPMNEEVNDKSVSLGVRIGKLTASEIKRILEKIMAELQQDRHKPDKQKKADLKHGKQTLKQLSKHNDGLSSVELTDPNLRLLHRFMKKHGVDFSAVKDGKGKYTLFFKAKDADAITHAIKGYTQKLVKQASRPSIVNALSEAKKLVQNLNAGRNKEKNKSKGERGR